MGKVLIVRHGHTASNGSNEALEYVRGWDDMPLDSKGIEQAIAVASRISKRHKVDAIYCSDLLRTRQTAETISRHTRSGVIPSDSLRTWNLGELTGKPVHTVVSRLQYYEAHPEESPRNGESYVNFHSRYEDGLREAMHEARRSKNSIVLVTHGRNVSATPGIISGQGGVIPYQKCPGTGELMTIKPNGKSWKLVWLKHHVG